ncbi:uncharacterized protein LOC119669233 [Teleopsis dalmanni]|uniref:uncharacterized protein LOC119669233 n=1 Tax=Teleopsis dalmanni TaxID=139649 RepID=UPI0018CF2DCB|nr:uncharacterized protein LOC119669233 [Teleopsis dalmanni]
MQFSIIIIDILLILIIYPTLCNGQPIDQQNTLLTGGNAAGVHLTSGVENDKLAQLSMNDIPMLDKFMNNLNTHNYDYEAESFLNSNGKEVPFYGIKTEDFYDYDNKREAIAPYNERSFSGS